MSESNIAICLLPKEAILFRVCMLSNTFVAVVLAMYCESEEKLLFLCCSYLASGLDICNVALAYRVGIETARRSIHVTCRAIWARLKDHFMKVGNVRACIKFSFSKWYTSYLQYKQFLRRLCLNEKIFIINSA